MTKERTRAFNFILLFGGSFRILKANDPLRLAGATAFFTTFALPPILIIILQLFGLVVDADQLGKEFFHTLSMTVGKQGALQIRTIFRGMKALGTNIYITIGGFIFLMFVATTLFKVIKDSINQLWEIRIDKPTIGIQLRSRFKSLLVIIVAGILFIASLLADGLQSVLGHYLQDISETSGAIAILVLNKLISLSIVTTWFTLVFKFLPDGRPHWRVAFAGGLLTGVLFTIGKFILRMALPYKNISSVFGAAGSFVLLLLFVFYSSFILYFGACFTKMYAQYVNRKIRVLHHAIKYKLTELKLEEGNPDVTF
jgi:membrane protein